MSTIDKDREKFDFNSKLGLDLLHLGISHLLKKLYRSGMDTVTCKINKIGLRGHFFFLASINEKVGGLLVTSSS